MKIGDTVLMTGGTIPGIITADLGNGNFEATWTIVKTFVFRREELRLVVAAPVPNPERFF